MRKSVFIVCAFRLSVLFAVGWACALPFCVRAAAPSITPIYVSGSPAHRLTITVLAEGYRAAEHEQFRLDATNLVNSFFAAEPFAEYKGFFNVQAVFVESLESGSDHPGYPVAHNTYFNSSYDMADRLLTIPAGAGGMGKVNSLIAATVPETDLTVLLVNDLVYGGSGGSLLVVSRSSSAPEIVIHESGHTLAGLGDEYTDASGFVPSTEPPNTTRQTVRSQIKWNSWISSNTPVPTPSTAEFQSNIGLFEGAQNQLTGWFRPKFDCGMRRLGTPFCEVCREALIKSIYAKVPLAEAWTPAELTQTLRSVDDVEFTVEPLRPSSHALLLQWFVDGVAVADATNETFTLQPEPLSKGAHLVRVDLRDTTSWVRNDPAGLLKQSITWRIDKLFSLMSSLQLTVIGSGTVSGAANGEPLEVGRTYRLVARPGVGQLFAGWSGGTNSNLASLSFAMQTNLGLVATFVPNPFLHLQGDYAGLFRNETSAGLESSGLVRLKVRKTGSVSGKLSMVDRDYPFSGKFDATGHALLSIKRSGETPLQLEIAFDGTEVESIRGTLSDIAWQSAVRAERVKGVESGWLGKKLTLAVPGRVEGDFSLGDSVGTVKVGPRDLRIVGLLADGSRFSQVAPWVNGGWPLFWRSKGGSLALGWVGADVASTAAPFTGDIDFLKRDGSALYEGGITNQGALRASFYESPARLEDSALNVAGTEWVFAGGNLAAPLRGPVALEGKTWSVSGVAEASVRLDVRTGLLSGSFRHSNTGSSAPVHGVILQNETNLAGFFLGTNQSGRIFLEIPE